ncbi:MAG TPA: TIGR03435 family protein [Pyrinomonadaceae bacterium]|jgi:uncharacterized protein (TIGR03435 family)
MRNLPLSFVFLLITIFSSSTRLNAQPQTPEIGAAAPNLNLSKVLQANKTAAVDLNGLKGNVVVLEFWATWCVPCIPAIKHFNELSEKFKDKPVRFIAVSDDDELAVARFIKSQPIRGWIGLDNNRATIKSYQAMPFPHTVVIDRNGRIAAITQPKNVTEAVLNDLLADKQISLPLKKDALADLEWDKSEAADGIVPLTQVIIKPSNVGTSGSMMRAGHFTADGAVFLNLIVAAYQTTPFRVINNLPESDKQYKVSIIVPPDRENTLFPLFQQALVATFGINARREMRERDVFLLGASQGAAVKLQQSRSAEKELSMMRGTIRSKKQQVKELAQQLEMLLGRPVIDKTGLTGEYDWELPYSRVDKNVLLKALSEKLGLELTETKQAIEMLVVEKSSSIE